MNQSISSKPVRPALSLVVSNPSSPPARKARRPLGDLDPFTRGYRRLTGRLRAACARYVDSGNVDDLVQDVWTIASQHPAKRAESDDRTLAWLIGIAKKCARSYAPEGPLLIPVDELLASEAGDDLEGRAAYEDVDDLIADRWGDRG